MLRKIQVIIIKLLFLKSVIGDYCEIEKSYCPELKGHIGCAKTIFENGNCVNVHLVTMDQSYKHTVLSSHNYFRNRIASGEILGFPSANKMKVLHWNDELAKLAEQHVKHCLPKNDLCRATEKYPFAGQNIARVSYLSAKNASKFFVEEVISKWFELYKYVPSKLIQKYQPETTIDAFANMMQDENDAIGCGYLTYVTNYSFNGSYYNHMLTCNYGKTFFMNKPIYSFGNFCSDCSDSNAKCSKSYKFLCDTPSSQAKLFRKFILPCQVLVVFSLLLKF